MSSGLRAFICLRIIAQTHEGSKDIPFFVVSWLSTCVIPCIIRVAQTDKVSKVMTSNDGTHGVVGSTMDRYNCCF